MNYFVFADVTFFEFVLYTRSSYCIEVYPSFISLSFSVPAPVPDVSSSVPPTNTTEPSAPKPLRDFRYHYTHQPKVLISESVPADSSPAKGPPS